MKTWQFEVRDHCEGWAVVAHDGTCERVCISDSSYHLCLKVAYSMNQLVASLGRSAPVVQASESVPASKPAGGNLVPLVPPQPVQPGPDRLDPQREPTTVDLTVPAFMVRNGSSDASPMHRKPVQQVDIDF